MGVAGLATNLEPYAVRCASEDLDGYLAVVDGPALAYHAHRLAAEADQSCLPSYANINATAIRWLKSLGDINIKVSAILFDGALPNSKKSERAERLRKGIQHMSKFRLNHGTNVCPIPRSLGSVVYPLLAPSLMEALSRSEFAHVTRNVPGEADDWCASCAKHHPRSVVFTSDTDLILYEYSPEAFVIFFRDAILSPNPSFKVYSPTGIRLQLKLKSLMSLAYTIQEAPGKPLTENVQRARSIDLDSLQYHEFSSRYSGILHTSKPISDIVALNAVVNRLDVRVSEFVHQALATEYMTAIPEVFLPLLFEDVNQGSAWNLGRDHRLLAYSLLMRRGSRSIREHMRRGRAPAALNLKIYSQQEMQAKVAEILSDILTWTANIPELPEPALAWSLIAIQFMLRDLKPPYVYLLTRVVINGFDNTWDFVQLHARLQTSLYSLRMLKQCISVWLAIQEQSGGSDFYDNTMRLSEALSSLPTIPDLFSMPGQSLWPSREDVDASLQRAIREAYVTAGLGEGFFGEAKSKRQRKREKRDRKAQQSQQTVPERFANNSFSALGTL
ncbi:hypothetical protein CC78DRAFT_266266 [Lojkania enalia]|uniref:Asteroid domain-containing protein n=1 Tax=Lojkania enalia TaxID=147567 RepID=A0A9P4K9V2_9PLEO|nr:hypothetical protein CC78DRAFT_266266 [Didymosphaeria enalia]